MESESFGDMGPQTLNNMKTDMERGVAGINEVLEVTKMPIRCLPSGVESLENAPS